MNLGSEQLFERRADTKYVKTGNPKLDTKVVSWVGLGRSVNLGAQESRRSCASGLLELKMTSPTPTFERGTKLTGPWWPRHAYF